MSPTQLFNSFVENGNGGAQFAAVLAQLAGNNTPMPVDVCYLLNLPANSTYNAAYVQCSNRLAHGQNPLL